MLTAMAGEGEIQGLPSEVLEVIFFFLDGRTIGRAHSVCRQWRNILSAMSSRSQLWYHRCKLEIPRYTLLHLCNTPIEAKHRTGTEWRDVYIRWCTCRGKRLHDPGTQLELKKTVEWSPGDMRLPAGLRTMRIGSLCFTDDLFFVMENKFLVVYDLHSEASLRTELPTEHSSFRETVSMTTLGIQWPVDTGGRTHFQLAVERVPLVIMWGTSSLDLYVGLKHVCSVPLRIVCYRKINVCAWYDTVVLPFTFHDDPEVRLRVFRAQANAVGEPEKYTLQGTTMRHPQEHRPREPKPCYFSEATVIGDRVVTLDDAFLLLWDTDTGEIITGVDQPFGYPSYGRDKKYAALSWMGTTVAAAKMRTRGTSVVALYHLDADCTEIRRLRLLQPGIDPVSIQLLYDDTVWVINQRESELLLGTGTLVKDFPKSNKAQRDTPNICGSSPSTGTEQGDSIGDETGPKETGAEQSEVHANAGATQREDCLECDEQESGEMQDDKRESEAIATSEMGASPFSSLQSVRDDYRQNLSSLLGISVDSPLWENYGRKAHLESGQVQQDIQDSSQECSASAKASDYDYEDDDSHGYDEYDDDHDYEDDVYWFDEGDDHGHDDDDDDCGDYMWYEPDSDEESDENDDDYLMSMLRSKRDRRKALPRVHVELTKSKSFVFRVPHQGCEKIDWKFTLRDTSLAMETVCHHPCTTQCLLYRWSF